VITSIASSSSSLKQYAIGLEISARLMKTAKDAVEDQGEGLMKLLESVKMIELSVNPDLGSNIDIRG
jgi:hypothetical protein